MPASLSKLGKICAKNPTSILFARLAEGFLQKGDVKRALDICRQGLRYRPSYVAGHLVMGKCHLAAGRFEEGRQEFQKVLQLDSDNLAAYWHLGQIDLRMGWEDLALQNFKVAFALDPFNAALAEKIESLQPGWRSGDAAPEPVIEDDASVCSDAPPALQDAEEAPEPPAPETGASVVAKSPAKEPEGALASLVEALFERPRENTPGAKGPKPSASATKSIATVTLAELYANQGQIQQAVTILERVLERESDNDQVKVRLAELRSAPPKHIQ